MKGARFWRPDVPTRLKKCSEFISPACDPVATDGCCAVIPCAFCLQFDGYDTLYGSADFDVDEWRGSIGGMSFRAYWERNYETGECEFIVTLNAIEIYRSECYLISCRDPSDSAHVTIDGDDGVLSWMKVEPRPLPYVTDYETNCRTWFCGTCECTCRCLCVTISDQYGFPLGVGELCDSTYDDCTGPVWEGNVGGYDLSLVLGRDEYGNCIITSTVDGYDQPAVQAVGCADISATITLDDGLRITIICKRCHCNVGCGDGCCVPFHTDPLYPNGVLDQIPFSVTSDCLDLDGETGLFTPLVPTSTLHGACGFCASYHGDWAGTVPGEFATGLENPLYPGTCLKSPCSVSVCLVLECNDEEDTIVGQNACCSKMRLWVGTQSIQVGDIGERPIEPVVNCSSWRKFSPSMCECDEVSGIIATFPVSFSLDCAPIVGGVCAGESNCCQVACAFDVVI